MTAAPTTGLDDIFTGMVGGSEPKSIAAAESILRGLLQPQGLPQAHAPSVGASGGSGRSNDLDPRAAGQDTMTRHILGLLQGVGEPKDNPATARATSLEYKGQWQPKPNGAETGHGVVPKDWAIELASESDRTLATFGWAGGAQLCLSNAFREVDTMNAQAQDLIDSGTCTEDDPAVQCIRTIANATEEREALMRRQWCDVDFQQGEEANKELLRHLERDFAGQLAGTAAKQMAEEKKRTKQATESFCSREAESTSSFSAAWYNIKIEGGTKPGKVYLSAQVAGEGSVDMHGYDDESGRQRWHILPGGEVEPTEASKGADAWYHLRLMGGTSQGRRLLSRGARGRVELSEHDDGSGRHRWHVVRSGSKKGFSVRPAVGDPGTGIAAEIEAAACGTCLAVDADGGVGLHTSNLDDASGRYRWMIPCGPDFLNDGTDGGGTSVSSSSRTQKPPNSADDVVSVAVRSGADKAVILKDLSNEQMGRVLNQNRNLGTAIDLVGAYLKNYEIDKADRLCTRIEPMVRERGGVWIFKFLNFFTTVRMKQSRYEEALEMYEEYETLIKFSPKEAWELYDTVYRNYGWIHTSLHNYEKALEYFEKSVEVKRANGIQAHWFDQWDLGKTHARLSLVGGKPQNLELALQLICEGVEMHKSAEPQDIIMRCKMLNSAGECASILGDFTNNGEKQHRCFTRSAELHQEALDLYMQTLGPGKPLTGWAMEDLAGVMQRLKKYEEEKSLLHGALQVECSKDIIKLSSVARLLDSVLQVHRVTGDCEGLAACGDAVNIGLQNLQKRRIDKTEAPSYAALLQKIANMLLSHSVENRNNAISLLEEALACLDSGGMRPKGMARTQDDKEDDEREQKYVPHAGQQEMQVNASELRVALKEQIELLRAVHDCMEAWPAQDGEADFLPEVEPEAPFEPPAPSFQAGGGKTASLAKEEGQMKAPCHKSASHNLRESRVLQVPTHFEVIEDDFPEVD